eukprot:4569328-Prorocentrum_lima.AAC.1
MHTEIAPIVGAPFGTAPGSKGTFFMTALWPVGCAGPSPLSSPLTQTAWLPSGRLSGLPPQL